MGIWRPILSALVRWLLLLLLAPLVARGILDQETVDGWLGEAAGQIVTVLLTLAVLGWSILDKIITRTTMKEALVAPASSTIAEVKATVAAMPVSEQISGAFSGAGEGNAKVNEGS